MSSQLITLKNLNTVYKDIRDRIDALGDVYSPKGSKTCEELNALLGGDALEQVEQGYVYNVIINEANPAKPLPGITETLKDGDNVVCVGTAEGKKWAKLGGIYELANNNVAGLVFLGEGTDFTNTVANTAGYAELGLNMGSVSETESDIGVAHKTYVKVPFADSSSEDLKNHIYGLVSTKDQTFSGEKTFLNNIKIQAAGSAVNTYITPDKIEVGRGGETSTGILTIYGNANADSNSSLGEVIANSTKVSSLTADSLNVSSGTVTVADGSSLGNIKVIGESSEINNLSVEGTLTASNFTANTLNVSNVNPFDTAEGSALYANTINATGITVNETAEAKKLNVTDTLKAPTVVASNTISASTINANDVTVTTITGSGNASTLNAQTINISGDSTASLTFYKQLKKGASGAPAYGEDIDGQYEGLLCDKNFGVLGHLYAHKVHNAVWNDLADAIEIDCKPEYGYVYCFDGEHYNKSSKYCQKGIIGIHSDTAGMIMGEKGSENELNCAVAGFVLAHTDKVYASGTPLSTGKNGVLTKMKKKDLILHPDRLVANFWKKETAEKWNGVEVNNRHWVKVR